jgi:site-specific recombinase XerD
LPRSVPCSWSVTDVKVRLLTVRWRLEHSGGSNAGGARRAAGRRGRGGRGWGWRSPDPVSFQEECLRAFEASQVGRGFSELTIVNGGATLHRFLDACGRPAWEVTREDIDRVVGGFAAQGLAASTRRLYVQAFKNFCAFLAVRKAAEIEAAFGIRMENPVDEFNAARHVSADSPAAAPPPAPERLEDFFGFLRERIAGARKYSVAGRDYALFRTLYLAGLRAEEAAMMDRADVHFGRGPFGKLHVRFGKGAKTFGPRPRWVPMLDGLDLILRWYLDEVRPWMGDGRRCSATRAAAGSTAARSATGWPACWRWSRRQRRPAAGTVTRPGSARTRSGTPARPATTSGAWTWSRSSRCSATGMSGPRCATSPKSQELHQTGEELQVA